MMKLKELKKGEAFTKKMIEYPTDRQVWVKGEYDRSERAYWCYRWSDVNDGCYMKGSRMISTEFVF